MLATQHLSMEHPLEVEVGGISCLARDLGPGVGPRNGTPNRGQTALCHRDLQRRALCRSANGLDDARVARAAAEVALERLLDLLVGGLGISVEQSFGGHDHPRGAEAALHRPVLNESLLQRMQLAVRSQPLNRFHARSIGAGGLSDAGAHRIAVHDHRAGPAVPLAAAVLGPREMQLVPQHLQQSSLGADLDLMGRAVDVQGDCLFLH